ncbi:MAG TPA: hypothetical protein VN873_13740 [Candidatus Angelobacter sp.]|nr:hypothetical protein [Candidatus Angelobacter sp.]
MKVLPQKSAFHNYPRPCFSPWETEDLNVATVRGTIEPRKAQFMGNEYFGLFLAFGEPEHRNLVAKKIAGRDKKSLEI